MAVMPNLGVHMLMAMERLRILAPVATLLGGL